MPASLCYFHFHLLLRGKKVIVTLLFLSYFHQGDTIPGEPGAKGLAGFPGRRVSSACRCQITSFTLPVVVNNTLNRFSLCLDMVGNSSSQLF